jgi:hypothetical protein
MSATFQALFYPVLSPPSFGVNVQIMKCGKHQPTLLLCNQLRCCGRLQSSHKQISSAKFPFPMCQRLVDSIHLCHISCLPFWSIWRLWNVASINQPSCNASCNLLQVACLFSPHFPLMLFRHLNYLSGKKLAGRQENLTNLANMHWVLTSLGRDNKGCVTLWPCPFTLKKCILGQKKNYGNSNIFTMQKYNFQKIL